MAKAKLRSVYICNTCGHQESKWLGKCPSCGAWNSMAEETVNVRATRSSASLHTNAEEAPIALDAIDIADTHRLPTGISELDRVLGGGLVPGSLVLVGGDPGIGKSTLLLQTMGHLAQQGQRVLYVSAEESPSQVKLRADRLGITHPQLYLLATTHFEKVLKAQKELKPDVLVLDSIQTIGLDSVDAAIGTVSQIRALTSQLLRLSKGEQLATFTIGHVTKEGAIAGPKLMEHMVDTVLYFEGDRSGPYRVLRSHKNRFGSAQEIGIFDMGAQGLMPVANPSEVLLGQRRNQPGSCVVTSMEGSRPLLLETQALVAPSPYGTPRRTVVGFEQHRAAMLAAILSVHADVDLTGHDLFLNIAGGVRVQEPAIDLGMCLALVSAYRGTAIDAGTVVIGEVGLSGEVRAVTQLEARLKEVQALGFSRAIAPEASLSSLGHPPPLEVASVASVAEAVQAAGLLA